MERLPPDAIGGRHRAYTTSTPGELFRVLPLTGAAARSVSAGRRMTRRVLAGDDDRLLVIVGPCSVHDMDVGLAYAESLGELAHRLADDVAVVMRVYVEKPRTSVGWTGLLADPALDGSLDVDRGLRTARELMLRIAEQGLPIATEWLSPAAPAYLADLISWGAIGARTVESQVHRQLASGLPMPVGMKNGSTGSVGVAVDAIRSAAAPHAYLGFDRDGRPVTLRTSGKPDCQFVLPRGTAEPADGREWPVHRGRCQHHPVPARRHRVLPASHALAHGPLPVRGRHRHGFVRSEGVGVVVLKRLDDALRDGDPVAALLLGSAVTNDGAGSGLLLRPSVEGQADMLREACASAGIKPSQLDYVEAHGTGASVGDAVELSALAHASGRDGEQPLLTGSVKTNLGHAEAAAGIAGLIKTVLMLRHGTVPASLHLNEPNPLLAQEGFPVEVVTSNRPLPAGSRSLLGVSSFGLSGTNGHLVVAAHEREPANAAGVGADTVDDTEAPTTAGATAASAALLDASSANAAGATTITGDAMTVMADHPEAPATTTAITHSTEATANDTAPRSDLHWPRRLRPGRARRTGLVGPGAPRLRGRASAGRRRRPACPVGGTGGAGRGLA
nr:3-deoxy-7-phosphoheptulonate synthase [Streptomyces sp. CB01201]